jgi:hypothetical protein
VPGDVVGGDGGGEVMPVDPGVVVAAEQRHIQEAGRSAVDPMSYVMGVGLPPKPRTPSQWSYWPRKGVAMANYPQEFKDRVVELWP